jgi:hypothetical protein
MLTSSADSAHFGKMDSSNSRVVDVFLFWASCVLLAAGVAKLISSFGNAHLLLVRDPVLKVHYRHLFEVAGVVEVLVGAFCLRRGRTIVRVSLVAWVATNFLAYRLGLAWVGWPQYCPCLGTLTDYIKVPPALADITLRITFGAMLVGTYAILATMLFRMKPSEPKSDHRDFPVRDGNLNELSD